MVVLLAGTFGVLVGLLAGYKGGRIDRWLMGWVDVQVSFPGLLLAMLLIALVGGSVTSVTVILAVNGWMVYGRMTRGVVLSAKRATVRRGRRDWSVASRSGSCSSTSCPTW